MFKDTFISVKDNIVKKVTNPFLSTFVGVWIVRNWEFVYSIFFFDDSYSLEMRLTEIESYFADYSIWDVAITILITFGILIATFILLSVSRLIVNFFDKTVTPWTYKITDIGSVVLKESYQTLESEISRLENRYQKEKETRLVLREENERLEKRIGELLSNDTPELSDNDDWILEEEDLNKIRTSKIIDKLKELHKETEILEVLTNIKNGEKLSRQNEVVRNLIKFSLIRIDARYRNKELFSYLVTDLGNNVIKAYLTS